MGTECILRRSMLVGRARHPIGVSAVIGGVSQPPAISDQCGVLSRFKTRVGRPIESQVAILRSAGIGGATSWISTYPIQIAVESQTE